MSLDRSENATLPSMDTALDALADEYRRRLLVALLEHGSQDDGDIQIPSDIRVENEDPKALETEMVHVHLPRLEEAGFIIWDSEAREVRAGPEFEEIRPLLRLLRDHADELPDDWL